MADAELSPVPKKKGHLTFWIVLAIVLAVGFALILPTLKQQLKLSHDVTDGILEGLETGGDIFLSLLKMVVVPLVVVSVMNGILGMGDIRKLGKPGLAAIGFYLSTTILAVIVGLIVVNVMNPGGTDQDRTLTPKQQAQQDEKERIQHLRNEVRKSLAEKTGVKEEGIAELIPGVAEPKEEKKGTGVVIRNLVMMLFTDNLFESAVSTDLLPLIAFSIVFAGMLTTMGNRVKTLTEIIDQCNDALIAFILLLMKLAPLGIFCLVAAKFGKENIDGTLMQLIRQTGAYSASVLVGLAFHSFVTLPLILWIFTKRNPYVYMYQMSQALLMAFSTASSSATLPVTMETAQVRAGVSEKSTNFVLPLGATINMDGTALYEAVAAIFIAQIAVAAGDYELTMFKQVVVALTATLAAIGAAGIPEAGLVTMLIVLNAVGLPLEYMVLILPVDWLLDRFRTTVNVFGDSVGAAVVEKALPEGESKIIGEPIPDID